MIYQDYISGDIANIGRYAHSNDDPFFNALSPLISKNDISGDISAISGMFKTTLIISSN